MQLTRWFILAQLSVLSGLALADHLLPALPGQCTEPFTPVSDAQIAGQRSMLQVSTRGMGFGPQSPKDIDTIMGQNQRKFGIAPHYTEMNLCNINIHLNAEHKGGEFTKYAGNGNGQGYGTGYQYSGALTRAERSLLPGQNCRQQPYDLIPGDTIEVQFMHTSAQVMPGNLHNCFMTDGRNIHNPALRIESVVAVLVNDPMAADFTQMTKVGYRNGLHQAINIPNYLGRPIVYQGSSSGAEYNTFGSPYQVTWSVRPRVIKVNYGSVKHWLKGNRFNETHARANRNLITDSTLLSGQYIKPLVAYSP